MDNITFMQTILLPEFFGYIRAVGNQTNGDHDALINDFKKRESVHKLFKSFLNLHGTGKAL